MAGAKHGGIGSVAGPQLRLDERDVGDLDVDQQLAGARVRGGPVLDGEHFGRTQLALDDSSHRA
jgi:hypothetical protein